MLTIRLSRVGKKNKPMYRLVISEKARDPYGRALEILGSYNPHTKELQAKNERIKHWLSKGAQLSPTVNNLLIEKDVIKGEKEKASKAKKKKKGDKEEEKKEDASAPSTSSGQDSSAQEKPVENKPVEEAPKEEKPAEEEAKKE